MVQLNLGLNYPTVKLTIDFQEKPQHVTLKDEDLFIKDGRSVHLTRKTIEYHCRQAQKISYALKINILYLNSSSDLVEFPDQLFIADLDESNSQQVMPSIRAGPPGVQMNASNGLLGSLMGLTKNGNQMPGSRSTHHIKVVIDEIENSEPSSQNHPIDDIDQQFFGTQLPQRLNKNRETLTSQAEFCDTASINKRAGDKGLQRQQSDSKSESLQSELNLSDLCKDLEAENSEGGQQDQSQSQSSDQASSDDDPLGNLCDEEEQKSKGGDMLDLDNLCDTLEGNNKEDESQSKMTEEEFENEPGNHLRRANLQKTSFEINKLQRRPSVMQKRSNVESSAPSLIRGQSFVNHHSQMLFGSEPPLKRVQSQVHKVTQNDYLQLKQKLCKTEEAKSDLEQRLWNLEQGYEYLMGVVDQLCHFNKFNPSVIPSHQLQQQQYDCNNTIDEVTDKSECSSRMTNPHQVSKKKPTLMMQKFNSVTDLGSSSLTSSSRRRHQYLHLMNPHSSGSSVGNGASFSNYPNQHLGPQSRIPSTAPSFQQQNSHSQGYIQFDSGTRLLPMNSMGFGQSMVNGGVMMQGYPEEQRPDIMFAYANAFGYMNNKNEFQPLSERQIIQPDVMFETICRAVRSCKKRLSIHKKILNFQSFDDIVSQNPRVLIIMCHGMLHTDKNGNEKCCFCFEHQESPYLIDKYDEERLFTNLKNKKSINIDVIILSTCHSERLGQKLVTGIQQAPAVIAINTTDQIAQSSTFKFNEKFIQCLIRGKHTVQEAFNDAKDLVAAMPQAENKCCCCDHGHTPQCLFVDFVKNDCKGDWEKACQLLHQTECLCYSKLVLTPKEEINADDETEDDAKLYISHEHGCQDYKNFYKKMTSSNKRLSKQLDNQDLKGYLQEPLATYEKGKFNLKCCCQSHVVHRESDKFMLVNAKNEMKLQKKNVFEILEEGEPEVFEKNYDNIKGLNDNRRQLFPRKEEIYEILTFLKDQDKKVLLVSGPKGIYKMKTVAKAIRYASEHDFEMCKDGAYNVDLQEVKSMQDVFQLLIDTLNLTNPKAEQHAIMNDTFLKSKKSTLVFNHLPFDNKELMHYLQKFISKLQWNTQLSLIIVIQESNLNDLKDAEQLPLVTMDYMEKKQAIEFLKRIIFIERKTEFIRGINLEKHKLIDIWEKMKFVDNEAFQISHSLSKRNKLIDIANAMEQRLSMNAMDQSKQQVGIETTLSSFTVINLMIRTNEKLLNDLIIFLTICPQGLGMTELVIVLKLFPTETTVEAKNDQIKLYIEMLQEVGLKSKGNLVEQQHDSSSERSAELQERRENIKDVLQSLLFFESQDEPYADTIVKLSIKERPALEFIVRNNSQIEQKIANISSQDLLRYAIGFYMPYMKYLLFKIRDMKSNSFSDHRFITASLLMGMWQKITAGPEFKEFLAIEHDFEARFQMQRQNLSHLLKKETIEQLVPNLFMKLQNPEFHSVEEDEIAIIAVLVNDLREISIVIPSILARLQRQSESIAFIEQARILFNFEERTWTHGVLDLMHGSNLIFQACKDNNFSDMHEFEQKKLSAFRIFKQIDDLEGQGESFFLWAIAIILRSNENSAMSSQVKEEEFDLEQQIRSMAGSIGSEIGAEAEAFGSGSNDVQRISGFLAIQMMPRNPNPSAIQCLDEALKLFNQAEQRDSKICSFNIAKSQFEKAQFMMDSYGKDFSSKFQSKQVYFMNKKKQILDCIKGVKIKVKLVLLLSKNGNGKPVQVNQNYIKNFYARCNLIKARLYEALNDESEALKFIQSALENLQNAPQKVAKKKLSLKLTDRSQSEMTEARSELTIVHENSDKDKISSAADGQIIQALTNLKNLILLKLRINANNLFTFAKATPLVSIKKTGASPISDATRSDFDLRSKMIDALEDTRKQFKVKFDILTNRFLKEIAKNGTRLLHITSDIFKENELCAEGVYGICNELPLKKLHNSLKQIAPYGLQTDVVGIALPKSVKIGEVFRSLKVKHVLCFDEKDPYLTPREDPKQMEEDVAQYRFNFIYNFCWQFYTGLANEMTVIQAFQLAKDYVDDDQNQFEQIWRRKELPFTMEDLNIKAVLVDQDSDDHHDKLFDCSQEANKALCLMKGSVIDTSRIRGQLLGFIKNKNSYVGQKCELFEVIRALSSRSNPCPLVHIRGLEHVGKSRFVQEVCYYFYCHNQFRYIIMFKDLSKIETSSQFKELMEQLNQQIESKHASESVMTQSIDNDSQQEEDEESRSGPLTSKLDILWAFTNADKMKKDFWSRLESRLLDIYKMHNGIRYLMTSNENKKQFNFTCFHKEDDLIKKQDAANIKQPLKRSSTEIKSFQKQHELRMDLKLMPLKDYEAVDLVLYHTKREIKPEDFAAESGLDFSIKRQMQLEQVITNCRGLPYLLKQVADLLSKDVLLYKIAVEKQSDYLKGTQAHHKAKRKEMVVYEKKDRETRTERPFDHSLDDENSQNASGTKLARDNQHKRNKGKSKDKTGNKISKNHKRKERDRCIQASGSINDISANDEDSPSSTMKFHPSLADSLGDYSTSHVVLSNSKINDLLLSQEDVNRKSEKLQLTNNLSMHNQTGLLTKQLSEMPPNTSKPARGGDNYYNYDNIPIAPVNEVVSSGTQSEVRSAPPEIVINIQLSSNTSPSRGMSAAEEKAMDDELLGIDNGPNENSSQGGYYNLVPQNHSIDSTSQQHRMLSARGNVLPSIHDNDIEESKSNVDNDDASDRSDQQQYSDDSSGDLDDYARSRSDQLYTDNDKDLEEAINQPMLMRPSQSMHNEPIADLNEERKTTQSTTKQHTLKSSSSSRSSGGKPKKTDVSKKKPKVRKAVKFGKQTKNKYMLTKIEETANSTDSEEEKVSPSKKTQADQLKHQKAALQQQKKQGKSSKNVKKKDDWEAKIDQQFDTQAHKPDDKKER